MHGGGYDMRCPVHLTIFRTRLYFTYERLSFHMNNPPIACVTVLPYATLLVCFANLLNGPIQPGPATSLPTLCVLYPFIGHSLYRDIMIQCLPPCIICLLSFRRWTVVSISFSFWRMCLLCVYCIIRRISSVLLRFWVPTGSCMSNVPLPICDWALALHGTSTGSSMYVPLYAKRMGLRYRCILPASRIMSIR